MVRIEMVEDEKVPSCELEQKDILEEDGAEERLADSLKKCLKIWNQHSDVLMGKKRILGQHIEVLTEQRKARRPCEFDSNNCFVNADSADAEGELTAWGSQLKEKDNSVEDIKPWNGEIELVESMLN